MKILTSFHTEVSKYAIKVQKMSLNSQDEASVTELDRERESVRERDLEKMMVRPRTSEERRKPEGEHFAVEDRRSPDKT